MRLSQRASREPIEPLLCTIDDAAFLLAVSRETVKYLIDTGELPVVLVREGKQGTRIARSAIAAFVERNGIELPDLEDSDDPVRDPDDLFPVDPPSDQT